MLLLAYSDGFTLMVFLPGFSGLMYKILQGAFQRNTVSVTKISNL